MHRPGEFEQRADPETGLVDIGGLAEWREERTGDPCRENWSVAVPMSWPSSRAIDSIPPSVPVSDPGPGRQADSAGLIRSRP